MAGLAHSTSVSYLMQSSQQPERQMCGYLSHFTDEETGTESPSSGKVAQPMSAKDGNHIVIILKVGRLFLCSYRI